MRASAARQALPPCVYLPDSFQTQGALPRAILTTLRLLDRFVPGGAQARLLCLLAQWVTRCQEEKQSDWQPWGPVCLTRSVLMARVLPRAAAAGLPVPAQPGGLGGRGSVAVSRRLLRLPGPPGGRAPPGA